MFAAYCLALAIQSFTVGTGQVTETLEDVIKEVEAAEAKLADIEFSFEKITKTRDNPVERGRGEASHNSRRSGTVVRQGDKLSFTFNAQRAYAEYELNSKEAYSFDGKESRRVLKKKDKTKAHVQTGQGRLPKTPHLNSLFFDNWNYPMPLSKFLRYRERDSDGASWRVLGKEKVGELECLKLAFQEKSQDGKRVDFGATIWLAKKYSYFPIRVESYRPQQGVMPIFEGTYQNFEEIEEGVFLPSDFKSTVYAFKPSAGRYVTRTENWRVPMLKLSSDREDDFFSLDFEPGTIVQVLDTNGKEIGRRTEKEGPAKESK